MCESTAYLKKDGKEEMLMENVALIKVVDGDKFILEGLLGESLEVNGGLEEINLMDHRILFNPKG